MPKTADVFIHRKATFFKANSKVVPAKGWDVNTMRATVGFVPNSDRKDTAVEDLEQQEHGGDISGRAFIPVKQNRTGGQWTGNVRRDGRFRAVKDKIVDSFNSKAPNPAGQFRSSAYHAGINGVVIGSIPNKAGNRMVWRILSRGRNIKKKLLFVVKKGRKVRPAATHFMRKASLQSQAKMQATFIKHAEAKLATVR